jgi:hypothetical protein
MKIRRGDILKDGNGVKFIPVNVVGVMGAGLAKQFKDQNPDHYKLYVDACKSYRIRTETTVINSWCMFPTKQHYKDHTNLNAMLARLIADLDNIGKDGQFSITIPKIGCGLGGLNWNDVLPLVVPILLDWEEKFDARAHILV